MKSVVSNYKPAIHETFPRLELHELSGTIILMRDRVQGVVVGGTKVFGTPDWRIGCQWRKLEPEDYIPFQGSVTLEND